MSDAATRMQPQGRSVESSLSLWQILRSTLEKCVSDFNGGCNESVWLISTSDDSRGSVRISSTFNPEHRVEVAYQPDPARIICRFGAKAGGKVIEFGIREDTLELHCGGTPVALSVVSSMILMPLVPPE